MIAGLMNLHEIVMKLVGPVHPCGEHNADVERLKNMKTLTYLVDRLLFEIEAGAVNADKPEASIKAVGKYARDFLRDVHDAYFKEMT